MENGYVHDRTCVYNINYHLIWCTKYRRRVLSEKISERLYELLKEIGDEKGFTVVEAKVAELDHVHCFVSAPPKLSVTTIVKYLKGITGRKLFEQFPEIRQKLWRGELWNHSYYVETIGSVSEENIRRYIEHQSKSY
jgi:putative transposase